MIPEYAYMIFDIIVTCLHIYFLFVLMGGEERRGGMLQLFSFYLPMVIWPVLMTKMNASVIAKFLVCIMLIVSVGKISYVISRMKLLLYGIIYITILYASEMCVIQIWNMFNPPVVSDNIIYKEATISLIIVVLAVQFLLVNVFAKVIQKDKDDKSLKEILPIIFSGIPYIIVLECINLNLTYVETYRNALISICSSAVMLGAFLFNVIFNNHYLIVRKKAQMEESTLRELALKNKYYQKRLEDEERIKAIYHDLKNHFIVAGNVIDETQKYKLQSYENYYDTGNEFLNIIIADKMEKSKQHAVNLECNILYKEDFIQVIDLSTIFGNLLDNAIEACESLLEEERFVFLKVGRKGKLFILLIENKMSEENLNVNKLHTIKKNKNFHGFGLRNVKKAVRKYNGECSIKGEKGIFEVSIVIPIPQKSLTEKSEETHEYE